MYRSLRFSFQSRTQKSTSHLRSRRLGAIIVVLVSAGSLHAQPSGASVISGAATVAYAGQNTTVTAGNNSVLRWNSFEVGASQTVQFVQPSADSRVLNWIGGLTPSQIDGTIRANGQVYLVNPSGVYFGRTAVVDAVRLYAVGGALSREDFFAGNDRFTHLTGDVRNEGSLRASTVALIGRSVANSGSIVSRDGFVALASGDQVFLGQKGSSIFVDTGAGVAADSVQNTSTAGITNSGTIDAGQGAVALAAGDLYSVAISHTGKLRGADIRLQGQGKGEVRVDGVIDASSRGAGRAGGYVEVTGERIGLLDRARIDASGSAGGGTILVGGDTHGANASVRNAQSTFVNKAAELRADAIEQGNGGKVIVWSDYNTHYEGQIYARGAGANGSGGFAEISGGELTFRGTADLSAKLGRTGTVLLDPYNLTIDNNTDTNVNSPESPPFRFTPTARPSTLSWASILSLLATSDVEITTSVLGGPEAGNITVAASPLGGSYNSERGLTLSANADTFGGIYINAPIINIGTGSISLKAPNGRVVLNGTAGSVVLGTKGDLSFQVGFGGLHGTGTLQSDTNIVFDILHGEQAGRLVTDTPKLTFETSTGTALIQNNHDQGVNLVVNGPFSSLELISKDVLGLSYAPLTFQAAGQSFMSLRFVGSDINIDKVPEFSQDNSAFTATALSLGNSGRLTLPTNWSASQLTLENSGSVDLAANVRTLVLDKSGGDVKFSDQLDGPITVSGQSGGNVDLTAKGGSGSFIIGAPSLTGTIIAFAGGVSGPGTVVATEKLLLSNQNPVGGADSPLLTRTPFIGISKASVQDNVYISNGLDAGLTIEGQTSGTLSVTSLNGLRQGPAPIVVSIEGVGSATAEAVNLTSSSLTLFAYLQSKAVTINHTGSVNVVGGRKTPRDKDVGIVSPVVTFNGTGDVGTAAAPIWMKSPTVTINSVSGGGVFLDDGDSDLGINFLAFSGEGSFSGRDVSVLSSTPINVGGHSLSFISTGNLDLGNAPITAESLTLTHDQGIVGYNGSQISTLVLGGRGDDGAIAAHLSTSVANLVLNKTGNAQVYVDNNRDAGLTLSGKANGTVEIVSRESGRAAVSGLTIGTAGLSNGGSTTLSSSTLGLSGGVASPTLTLNTDGLVSGSGTLTAPGQLILNGIGNVGAEITPVSTNTPSLLLNKNGGVVYVDNGTAALTLTPTRFSGGGAFIAGNLSLLGAIDAGANKLSLRSAGTLDLGSFAITADSLTLAHDGSLFNYSSPRVTTLTLGGAGDDGTSATPFTFSVSNLVLSKTGSAKVYVDNRRDLGLTVSGSTGSVLWLRSMDTLGGAPAGLTLSSGGLLGVGPLTLNSSFLSLVGSLRAPSIALTNTGAVNGPGAINASAGLTLAGSGDFGARGASISTNTPAVVVNKSAGGVFLDNGTADLSLTTLMLGGGGQFAGGNLTLGSAIDAGSNSLELSAIGSVNLGANNVSGGDLSFGHGGRFTSSGTISASHLSLIGAGDVGSPDSFVQVRTPSLSVNQSAGTVYLDDGSLDLAFRPISFLGGGWLRSGTLSLLAPLSAMGQRVSFETSGGIDLGGNGVSADWLSLSHGGGFSNPGTLNVNTLALGGAGDDGTVTSHLVISVPNLILDKSGTASVYVDNRRDLGLTLTGSSNATIAVGSFNAAGTNSAQLTIGSGGVNTNSGASIGLVAAGGSLAEKGAAVADSASHSSSGKSVLAADPANRSVILTADTINLEGNVDTTHLTVNNTGLMSGGGRLQATSQMELENTGNVGSSASLINASTPLLIVNKPGGAVYLSDGDNALSLTPTAFAGGGVFSSGSFTLMGTVDVGTNTLTITTTGAIDLGTFAMKGDTMTFNNGGPLFGTGLVTAHKLDLGSSGSVGSVTAPLLYSGGRADVNYDPGRTGIYVGFFGRPFTVLPSSVSGVVSAQSQQTAMSQVDELAGTSESDSPVTPTHSSRRGGAAFRSISAKANLASAAREQLQALGVYARPLRLEERLSRERKEAVFVSVPERELPKESDFEVVDARIDPAALRGVLSMAEQTGLTGSGKGRLEQVARSLSLSFSAFSQTHPSGDAADFRVWLETRHDFDAVTVVGFLKSLHSTISQIELLGLTRQEIEVSKTQIFGSILRNELNTDPDFLRALIETQPRINSAGLTSVKRGDRVALR